MKSIMLILVILGFPGICLAQNYNPFIEELMNQANLDSLVSYVRILSGEDSVLIGDSTVLITHRISRLGNDLAADYLKQTLEGFGLEIHNQIYSEEGRNIYAIQRGTLFPEKYFIYCAHYDAVANHCADDNASGVAGVLEAARILSNHQFQYSIIYAFWDEEERGLKGSRFFAAKADSNNLDIISVLNFDMIGWDGDDDGLIDIHTREIANSADLANFLVVIDSLYGLPLNPVIYKPGTSASDHSAFWGFNYGAILVIEAYWGGDFNPYYHSDEDRIDKFNLSFFQDMAKLGLASIATLALESFIYYYPIYPIQTEIDKTFIGLSIDTLTVTTKFSNVGSYNFSSNIIFTSSDSSYMDSTALYDDGLHGDSLANDGIWGGFIHSIQEEEFFSIGISSMNKEIGRYYYTGNLCRFTTAGPLKIDSLFITQQSTSNYRVKPFLKNESQLFTVPNIEIHMASNDSSITQIIAWGSLFITSIAPGEVSAPSGFYIVRVDTNFAGVFNFNFKIKSNGIVYWKDSVSALVTEVEDKNNLPLSFKLYQNYPNPFNPTTKIEFSLPVAADVELVVYNILGQQVASLIDEQRSAGNHSVLWNANDSNGMKLSSGIYLYKLKATGNDGSEFQEIKKMVLLK